MTLEPKVAPDAGMHDRVCGWLGISTTHDERLALLAAIGPGKDPFRLPGERDAAVVLERLGVWPEAIEEIVAGSPSPDTDPEAWWLLERLHHCLVERDIVILAPPWPAIWPGDDTLSRFFHFYVFLAATEHVRTLHAERNIPEDITWATLGDLGLQVAHHLEQFGRPGFNGAFWMWQHFRGEIYRLGRLMYDINGDGSVGMHIPALGPLTPEACDGSIDHARDFFARHFPERGFRTATCTSWLLDDQLAEYLPPDSNIVRFQRRFTLVDAYEPGDKDVLLFNFGRVPESLDDIPQNTSLERAVVRHLNAGRSWRIRHGWFEL